MIYLFGTSVLDLKITDNYVSVAIAKGDKGYPDSHNKKKLFTIIFCVFVFLQVFNEINCRKIGVRDFNVFEYPFHNWWFIGIIIAICAIQYVQINFFSTLTRTVELSVSEWGGCVILGSTTLLVSLLLKTTPGYWLKSIPYDSFIDEDKEETNEYVEIALSKDPTAYLGSKKDDDYNAIDQDENWD